MNEKESYNNGLSPSAAEVNPAMRAAEAPTPSKLLEDEFLQRRLDEITSPSAAEVNPAMKAANSDEGIYRSR